MSANRNPYFFGVLDSLPQEHAYPPLCYVIFYFLSRFSDYSGMAAFDAGYTTMGLATAFLCVSIAALLIYALLNHACNKKGAMKMLLPFCLMVSGVVLNAYERANIILFAVALTFFFVLAYRSENKVIRELALIALAAATGLKGYPAIVGLLLLFDRRFADALRCALYAVALVFLPFLFFVGGFGNIPIWLHNISLNSQVYGGDKPVYGLSLIAYITPYVTGGDVSHLLKSVLGILDKVICIAALATCYFEKTRWKQVLLLCLVIVCLQTNSASYLGLYLLLGIVLFFNKESHPSFDWIFLILFLVFLSPFQVVTSSGTNFTKLLCGLSVDALLVILTVQSSMACIKSLRNRIAIHSGTEVCR